MITDKIKSNAIALMKMGDSPRKVSEDLELPFMLCQQWANDMGITDLTKIQANSIALSRVLEGEILDSDKNVEILKQKIEETAILIIDKAKEYVKWPDLQQAKALELLSNTCSKLYLTIISKSGEKEIPSNGVSLFEQLGRD